jgi:hypothetical protein
MYVREKISPFLISLALHALLLLILWAVIGERGSRIGTEGMQIEILPVSRSRVARRIIPRRAALRWDRNIPSTLRVKDKVKEKRVNPEIPDLHLDLSSPFADALVMEDESWLTRLEEKSYRKTGVHPLTLPRSRRSGISGPTLEKSSLSSLQGEEVEPPGIKVTDTLVTIADDLIGKNRSGKIDLIFLVDSSGTMRPYILMIARRLSGMAAKIKEADIDLAVGVVSFNRIEREDVLRVYDLTDDISQVKKALFSIRCIGDERALNALAEALGRLKLRRKSDKVFLLVTDERMKGEVDVDEVIERAMRSGVRIYVLGVDDPQQARLAEGTGGIWYKLPSSQEEMLIW